MIIRASDLHWRLNERSLSVVISINTISISLMEVTLNSFHMHSVPFLIVEIMCI